MSFRMFCLISLFVTVTVQPVMAKNTGDLFSDDGLEVKSRPRVDSDRYTGYTGTTRDMFVPNPQWTDPGKEMFRSSERSTKPDYGDMMPDSRIHGAPPDAIYDNKNIPRAWK